jgi:hypothetical protein
LRDAKRQYVLDHLERWVEELTESVEPGAGAADAGVMGGLVRSAERVLGRPIPSAAVASTEEAGAADIGQVIVCLPAADRADELAARLLALVLRERGLRAKTVPRAPEGFADRPAPAALVVSALPLDALANARHVARRARLHLRRMPVVVGLWGAGGDLTQSWRRLQSAGASRLVTTFATAVSEVESLLPGHETPEPAPSDSGAPVSAPPAHA